MHQPSKGCQTRLEVVFPISWASQKDAFHCHVNADLFLSKARRSRIVAPRHFVMRSKPMADDIAVLRAIYNCFNARDIDGVLDALTDDVAWANGMEGGYVHGREGVREYW